jgi:hypothetical protein
MTIPIKLDLPNQLVSEYIEYDRLYKLGNERSISGSLSFVSSSSSVEYTSTTGQLGILQSLQIALSSYLIAASDYNEIKDVFDAHFTENKLLNEIIVNTTQTPTYTDGKVTQIVHKDVSNNTIRTDTFTYTATKITEVRTLNTDETLTLEYYFDVNGTYNRTEVS